MRKNSGFSGNFSIFYALHWISVVYMPARKLNQTFFSGGIQAEIAAFRQKLRRSGRKCGVLAEDSAVSLFDSIYI